MNCLDRSAVRRSNVGVTVADELPRLLPSDGIDAVSVLTGNGPVCLVCEHASAAIPEAYRDLGLAPEDRHSHAAWDIGAAHLTLKMAARLGGPMVMARYSRLVCDLNRPPEAADAMPERVEMIRVPGNRDISGEDRAARAGALYEPFHAAVARMLDSLSRPVLVTVHSFTPVWNGVPRMAEIGFLHDSDPSLAEAMLAAYPGPHRAELNVPYSARDGVTHTLARHGTAKAIPNAMIEVRSDLLRDDVAVDALTEDLCLAIETALERVGG